MCTRVMWHTRDQGTLVSRSMDWPASTEPMLMVFPSGVERDGGLIGGQRFFADNPYRWTSRHASVVTAMFGVGAADGLNDQGLGAHLLYFNSCDLGERRGDRPGVQIGLWAQLLLDLSASVDEALEVLDTVELVMAESHGAKGTLHLAIEDAGGDSAVVEFVSGEKVEYHGSQYTIMTNDPTYDQQLEQLAQHDFSQPTRETPLPGNVNPRDRFVRASYFQSVLPEPANEREAVAGVLAIARNVSVPFGAPYNEEMGTYNTEYRTVCDLATRRYFFELTTSPNVMWVDLANLELGAGSTPMVLDPDDLALSGQVASSFGVLDPVPF